MYDLARRHGNPGLIGFAGWFWASGLSLLGAQDRARAVVSTGIDELTSVVRLSDGDTLPAEMLPYARRSGELLDWQKEFNTSINKIRYVIERAPQPSTPSEHSTSSNCISHKAP